MSKNATGTRRKHEPRSKRSTRSGACRHCGLPIYANTFVWKGWVDLEGDETKDRTECPAPAQQRTGR